MHDRSEWTKGDGGPKTIKNRTYKDLVEFTRPCATCGQPFSIFVTKRIASGHADSNSFALKNCEAHRRNKMAADTQELKDAIEIRDIELDVLRTKVADLEARLAKYELPAALASVQNNLQKLPWEG